MIGRKVQIVYNILVWDEKPKHWWNSGKFHHEEKVFHTGEIVDRAQNSAEYAVVCNDGKIRWVWSNHLRFI